MNCSAIALLLSLALDSNIGSGETHDPAGALTDPCAAGRSSELPGTTPVTVRGGASMVIYRDPVTGAILSGPPPGEKIAFTPELQKAVSTDLTDLVAEPSPVPGGGIISPLIGRFQSVMRWSRLADGSPGGTCQTRSGPDATPEPSRTTDPRRER